MEYQSQLIAPNPPLVVDLPPGLHLVPNPQSQPQLPTASYETVSPGWCYPSNIAMCLVFFGSDVFDGAQSQTTETSQDEPIMILPIPRVHDTCYFYV